MTRYQAHIRRRQYSHRGRIAHTWSVWVTNRQGKTVYSDDGMTWEQAVRVGLFDVTARTHVEGACAGIGGWDR